MEKLVSIIVPVYNVEKYLDQCVNSLINQTYDKIEIILVDDGSKDNSGRLCDEWAKKSNKIKAVHKKNAGLGMARNTGLEHVTGNYVMFIDSDDYLAENVVEKLLEKLLTEKVDAAFTGMIRFNDDKILSEVDRKYKDNTFRENELCEKYLMEMAGTLPDEPIDSYLYMSVCTGLYSMKVIKDYSIQFESERKMISEDFIFNIDYFSIAKGVTFIAERILLSS